jgi:hypothetical protein
VTQSGPVPPAAQGSGEQTNRAPMRAGGWVYAPGVTPEPATPPPSQRPKRDPGAQHDRGEEPQPGEPRSGEPQSEEPQSGESQARERYGPVEIARHVKGDGRALLLYSHAAGRGPA